MIKYTPWNCITPDLSSGSGHSWWRPVGGHGTCRYWSRNLTTSNSLGGIFDILIFSRRVSLKYEGKNISNHQNLKTCTLLKLNIPYQVTLSEFVLMLFLTSQPLSSWTTKAHFFLRRPQKIDKISQFLLKVHMY